MQGKTRLICYDVTTVKVNQEMFPFHLTARVANVGRKLTPLDMVSFEGIGGRHASEVRPPLVRLFPPSVPEQKKQKTSYGNQLVNDIMCSNKILMIIHVFCTYAA